MICTSLQNRDRARYSTTTRSTARSGRSSASSARAVSSVKAYGISTKLRFHEPQLDVVMPLRVVAA
jgi:hypothetical protein